MLNPTGWTPRSDYPVSGRWVIAFHYYDPVHPRRRTIRVHGPWCAGPSTVELTRENLSRVVAEGGVVDATFLECAVRTMPPEAAEELTRRVTRDDFWLRTAVCGARRAAAHEARVDALWRACEAAMGQQPAEQSA